MAANTLTQIPNIAARQSGESKVLSAPSYISTPAPDNPVARRFSTTNRETAFSVSTSPPTSRGEFRGAPGSVKRALAKPLEGDVLQGKRIVGWKVDKEGNLTPSLLLVVVDEANNQERYQVRVAEHLFAPSQKRRPGFVTEIKLDPAFTIPSGPLSQYKKDTDDFEVEEGTPGVKIISAALVTRPGRAWENNGAVRMVEYIALKLTIAVESQNEPGDSKKTKQLFIQGWSTEKDVPAKVPRSAVPNDGSDEEGDPVGDKTSFAEDVYLVKL